LKNEVKTYVEYYEPKVFGSDQTAKEFNLMRKYGDLRDAVALQFPARELMGTNRPHFLNGDPNNPVKLWYWKADEYKAVEVEAKGIFKKFKVTKKAIEAKSNKGARNGKDNWTGQWQLIMKRSLTTDNPKKDVQFIPGKFLPYSVNAWDGGNGESGTNKSTSTWNMLVMEVKTPPKVYVIAAIGFLVVGFLEVFAYRKINKK
jgi:DMSO reductase family type II enzyme heme b subunit